MKTTFIIRQTIIRKEGWAKNILYVINGCLFLMGIVLIPALSSCNQQKKEDHSQHQQSIVMEEYTCPMHPQIIRDKPGNCPICGMQLVKKEKNGQAIHNVSLNTLLKPTNEYVIASVPLISPRQTSEPIEIEALGYTAYNTSAIGTIAARVTGRIERLYVQYRFQKISKGQKIMEIYSPELMTAQTNLLYLLKSDKDNISMIGSAKQRLMLLGLSSQQIDDIIQTRTLLKTVSVYSDYSGHIHEAGSMTNMTAPQENEMTPSAQTTSELNLKEGMYIQKGQPVFSVYNPDRLWILINIYPQDQPYIKAGNDVKLVPEVKQTVPIISRINYIEPFFREGSKTIVARVNLDNHSLKLPVGSQVKATVFAGMHPGLWLPKEAVLSLGGQTAVFLKTNDGFRAHQILTGYSHNSLVIVRAGLGATDSVAANAQFLIDSESFIKTEND